MAETNRIWVRTSTLDISVHGKVRSSTKRAIPGVTSDATPHHWGWVRGRLVDNDDDDDNGGKDLSTEEVERDVRVLIQDRDSSYDNQDILIKGSNYQSGDIVMDNVYGNGNGDDENEDDDSSSVEDGYYDSEDEEEPNDDKYPDDLITLTHLHEASMVHCLKKRYAMNKIYTSTGPILIAMNPFKSCKQLYCESTMEKYWERGEQRMLGISEGSQSKASSSPKDAGTKQENVDGYSGASLAPHVFGIADDSFRRMMTKLEETKGQQSSGGRRRRAPPASGSASSSLASSCNQSILVSGESGAGKTVTTKFIMQYLASLSKRKTTCASASVQPNGDDQKVNIEQQVLQSNPILESFGNARTIRNDNSSRFGKFIEIQFTQAGNLAGACIDTYLLEKVRLVSQMDGERNYHIFYELMEGLPDEELARYFLSDYCIDDFIMTNQSGTYDRRDGVTDHETYQDLLVAMKTMGFSSDEQTDITAITCALLHSSNLTFNSITADESEIDRDNEHLGAFLSLMGLNADDLNRALCYFSITAGRETHLRSNSKEKAHKGLLGLIKTVYGSLFTYLVKRVNESIASFHSKTNEKGRSNASAASIGVLDIFGFESFKTNSFEQLCINYCNETLQQQFNLFVIKNEQEEYEREGILWSYVSFPDNQDVLSLISKKGSGILSILDDQCRAPGTTDKTFINDLYQKVSRQKRFQADYRQVGARKFAIIHYAGTVEYDSEGFLEKNRDEIPREATELLASSSNNFVKDCLAKIISGDASSPRDLKKHVASRSASKAKSSTVGGQFSRQLEDLRQKIDLTTPHYVRCLKPNDELVPDNLDPLIVADQLRCAGVIEAVRVSRLGYPQRYSHTRFVARYRLLGLKSTGKLSGGNRKRKPVDTLVDAIARKIVDVSNMSSDEDGIEMKELDLVSIGIQVGKTKVFLRRNAFETMERLRNIEMRNAAITMQALARRFISHNNFTRSRGASVKIQCFIRTIMACRVVKKRRCNHNATKIQALIRKMGTRKKYLKVLISCKVLQSLYRGRAGRKRYLALNMERKALVLQSHWRMYTIKNRYTNMRCAAIIIQCAVRGFKSRIRSKLLKKAALDLKNTAQERNQFRDDNKKLCETLEVITSKLEKANNALNDDTIKKKLKSYEDEIATLRLELSQAEGLINDRDSRVEKAEIVLKDCSHQFLEKEKNLQSQISHLEDLFALKDNETVKCRSDIEILKDELKIAMSRNSDLLEVEESLNYELELLRDEKNSLEESNTTIKEELTRSKAAVLLLQESTSSSESELEKVKIDHEQLTETITIQKQELKQMEHIVSEKDRLHIEVASLLSEVEAANTDKNSISDEINAIKGSLESSVESLDMAKEEIKRLRQKTELSHEAIKVSTAEIAAAKTENEALSKTIDEQTQKLCLVADLEVENEKHTAEISRLRHELGEAVNGDLKVLHNENARLEQNIIEITAELDKKASANLDLMSSMGSDEERLSCALEELNNLKSENKNLLENTVTQEKHQEEMEAIKMGNKLLSDDAMKLREELDLCKIQVTSLHEEKDSLQALLERNQNELKILQSEMFHLQGSTDSTTARVAELNSENERLLEIIGTQKEKLEYVPSIEAQNNELIQEVSRLHEEVASVKAANEQLKTTEDKLRREKETNKNQAQVSDDKNSSFSTKSSIVALDDVEEVAVQGRDDEIANLKDIISSLKAELMATSQFTTPLQPDAPYSDDDDYDYDEDFMKKELNKTKAASAQEILTLQDEVERLNKEISSIKTGSKTNAPITNPQTSKLIDSIMAKDEEIRDLRREIAILRDQLDSTTVSMLTESQSHLHGRFDDDDRSVISRIFSRGQQQHTPSVAKGFESKDVTQLKSSIESLRNELEVSRRDRDKLQSTLDDERERSAKELEAFAGALDGVDELRQAAEQMSREITRLKNQKDDEVPEDPFGDIRPDVVESLENGIVNFENAKRTIGTASLKSEQRGLWGKLRINISSLQSGDQQNYNASVNRKKRRGKENDDSSIFSSFF